MGVERGVATKRAQMVWPGGVGHASSEVFVKSALLHSRSSETTSWSKAEGAGFHKKARKVTY